MHAPAPSSTASPAGYRAHPLAWLLGSLLFFLIVILAGPDMWTVLENPGTAKSNHTVYRVLALMGIIVFITEPLIWHYIMLLENRNPFQPPALPASVSGQPSRPLWEQPLTLGLHLLLALPSAVLFIFKPVLRALLLYLSLGFLGDLKDSDNGWYRFFNIAVFADILLYYLCRLAPDWKFNPVNILLRVIVLHNNRPARLIADLLLILHTALISALLQSLMYVGFRQHMLGPTLSTLAGWWLALTLYNRLSLQPGIEDRMIRITGIRLSVLLLESLQLGISFLAFIWPYYFAGR